MAHDHIQPGAARQRLSPASSRRCAPPRRSRGPARRRHARRSAARQLRGAAAALTLPGLLIGPGVSLAGLPTALTVSGTAERGAHPEQLKGLFTSGLLPITLPQKTHTPQQYLQDAFARWGLTYPGDLSVSLVDPACYTEDRRENAYHLSEAEVAAVEGAAGDLLAVFDPARCEVYSARRMMRSLARTDSRLAPLVLSRLERAASVTSPVWGPQTVLDYMDLWADESWRELRSEAARATDTPEKKLSKAELLDFVARVECRTPSDVKKLLGWDVYLALRKPLTERQVREKSLSLHPAERALLEGVLTHIEKIRTLGEALLELFGDDTRGVFGLHTAAYPTPAFVLDVSSAESLASTNRWGRLQEVLEEDMESRSNGGEESNPLFGMRLTGAPEDATRLSRAAELLSASEVLTREVVEAIHDWTC